MKSKGLRILSLILALGLIASVAVSLLTCVVREPAITEHDFPYSVTYQLNGETTPWKAFTIADSLPPVKAPIPCCDTIAVLT